MDQSDLNRQAHDNAIEAGKKLADAQLKLDKAEKLLREASIRMSNARKFEAILRERQRKLDRGFVLLNKQRRLLQAQQLKEAERDLMVRENITNF